MTDAQPPASGKWKRITRKLVGLGIIVGLIAIGVAGYDYFRWKHFAVVVEGSVYRSGQIRPEQLESAIQKLGLKTVINLNSKTHAQESEICKKAGIQCLNFDMPSDGLGAMDDYAVILRTLRDPAQQPVLVHCQAGVARTGASVALYRMFEQGWDGERAIAELRSFERKGRIDPRFREHILAMRKTFESTTTMKK